MSVDRVLRQNFWVVLLGLLGLIAFVSARGVSAIASMLVGPDAKELSAPPLLAKSLPSESSAGHQTSVDPIFARNPFDSTQGPLRRPEAVPDDEEIAEDQGPLDAQDPMSSPACDGVRLLVVVASTDPDWSFASFQVGAEGKNVLRRRGQDVSGKNVEFIGWDRAFLSSGKSLCQAQLFKPGAVETPVAAPAPVASSGPPGSLDPAIAKGIRKVGANEYDIDRSVVDKILENQAELMKTARIIPDKEGDKVKGVRMFGIKSGSLLSLLGMENGDRLQTINGFDVSSPEKALEAYARLRAGADKLQLQINRRGADTNLDYNIK